MELAGRTPDGAWVGDLLDIPLQVKPAFYQTLMFKLLVMLIPVLLVALFFRYREVQLQKERRLRVKIADDLHDEVGSSLTRIWHQASQAAPDEQDHESGQKPLRTISETSREAIATMSDIVWSIDARYDTLRDLILRMKDYVYKLEDELDIPLEFTIEGQPENKKVSQIVRQNLFLLFKEAISNAIKHGDGGMIKIRMSVHEHMELEVVNNCRTGRNHTGQHEQSVANRAGDYQQLRRPDQPCAVQGGRGLQNMRRRAANMRGCLNIRRTGSEFRLIVKV